jgi:3-oxoacyl-[acyl-carrier-protein] synthase I
MTAGKMHITAAEVFCPVGLDVVQAATSVLTGVTRVEATSLMDDRFQPVTMGLAPEAVLAPVDEAVQSVPYMTAHTIRLLRLLAPCLQNLAAAGAPVKEMPMLLAGPSPCDRAHGTFLEGFFDHLVTLSGVGFQAHKSAFYQGGGAGFFEVLSDAEALLQSDAVSHVLVGGVDSLLDPMDLSRYLIENRITREGVMDGFTPGEGAALMALSRPDVAPFTDAPLAVLSGIGRAEEAGHRYSDAPYLGEGLAAALLALFDTVDPALAPVKTVFAGFGGEAFDAKSWGVAYLRNEARIDEAYHIEHPAEYLGYARAALAPIMTAVGAFGVAENMWEGPLLIWAASDDAPRGCALITGPSGSRKRRK